MAFQQILVLLVSVWLVSGQRPSFAGTKPIGYPELVDRPSDPLGNRFGEDLVLPIEAKGDRDLVERISKLPIDQQPFWYINWKALEENRKNPQTYQQRPNSFVDTNLNQAQNIPANSNNLNSRFSNDASQATNASQVSNASQATNAGQTSNASQATNAGQTSNASQATNAGQTTNANNANNFPKTGQNYRKHFRH